MTVCAILFLLVASDSSFRAGLIALQQGDLESARTRLESASQESPRDGRVWIALSQTYWRLHKEPEAEEAAAKASVLSPEDPAVLNSLVVYYSETHQTLKAAEAAAKYSVKVPEKDDARERAATLYFEAAQPLLTKEKFGDAATVLEDGLTRVPNNVQLELALGVAYYGLRRFDIAADAFLRTVELAPEIEQPYTFLGRMLDQIPSRLPQVTQSFADYELKHPASAMGYLRHAKALDAQSLDPEGTLRLLDKSLAIDGANPLTHFEKGTVLDRLQRFAEAAAEFERAAALAPLDPAVHYRLARDYERMGKRDSAQSEREKHAQLVKTQETMR